MLNILNQNAGLFAAIVSIIVIATYVYKPLKLAWDDRKGIDTTIEERVDESAKDRERIEEKLDKGFDAVFARLDAMEERDEEIEKANKEAWKVNRRSILKLIITDPEIDACDRLDALDEYEELGGNGSMSALRPILEELVRQKLREKEGKK